VWILEGGYEEGFKAHRNERRIIPEPTFLFLPFLLDYLMMFQKHFNSLLVLAVAVVGVSAQTSAPSQPDQCTENCIIYAAPYCTGGYGIPIDYIFFPVSDPVSINSVVDYTCLCKNANFQNTALACLQTYCTAADVQLAKQLNATYC
jgi:CFEM domain